jgi:hypothetical protein
VLFGSASSFDPLTGHRKHSSAHGPRGYQGLAPGGYHDRIAASSVLVHPKPVGAARRPCRHNYPEQLSDALAVGGQPYQRTGPMTYLICSCQGRNLGYILCLCLHLAPHAHGLKVFSKRNVSCGHEIARGNVAHQLDMISKSDW